jgi:tripartite-type tricarboxylate transporter receptor subunit TctC
VAGIAAGNSGMIRSRAIAASDIHNSIHFEETDVRAWLRPIIVPAALMSLMASLLPSVAQEFPTRPITLVVPLSAGGAMDIVARRIADKMSERLGQPVVVENRVGGGTVVAAASVAKAAPDGYTIMFTPSATLTTNLAVYKSLPYDPKHDFSLIALTSQVGFVLVVNPSLQVHNVTELVAAAKAKPGQLFYGSPGNATMPHLAGEMLKRESGAPITHVPYRGSVPALNDVVAGHTQMTFTDPAISAPLIQAGKLQALGVSSRVRVTALPDVPPLAEAGLPNFEAVSWHMIIAPAGLPQPIADKLHVTIKNILALPEIKSAIVTIGLIPLDTPDRAELQRFLNAEIPRWNGLVQELGLAGSQ